MVYFETILILFLDTAYAKNKDDGRWYYFDDSSVTSSSEDAVVVRTRFHRQNSLFKSLNFRVLNFHDAYLNFQLLFRPKRLMSCSIREET